MAIIPNDYSVDSSKNIRRISGTQVDTIYDLHRFLQSKATDLTPTGDDLVSMLTPNPSKLDGTGSTIKPMSMTLLNGFNVDNTLTQKLKFGSISQNSDNDIWVGVKTKGTPFVTGTSIYITQNGNKITKFWSNGGHIQILVKAKDSGSYIDSGLLTIWSREYGKSYSNDTIDLTPGSEQIASCTAELLSWITLSYSSAIALSSKVSISIGDVNYDAGDGNGSKLYKGTIALSGGITTTEAAQYLQAICSENSTTTINGTLGWKYTKLHSSYTANTSAPFGAIAGGKWFVAQGWLVTGTLPVDSQNYQMISHDGTAIANPTFTLVSVSGIPIGAQVLVVRDTYNTEYTLNGSHSIGATTITINESIMLDTPETGPIRIGGDRYQYTSYNTSTKQFTLSTGLTNNYNTSTATFVPYIDKTATSSTENSSAIQFVSSVTLLCRVRREGINDKKPYTSQFTLNSSGASLNINMEDDV